MDKQYMNLKHHSDKKKSQIAIEFMVLVSFALIIFIVLLSAVYSNISSLSEKKEEIVAEDIALKIQKELNLAARALDGYHREFALSQKIAGFDYTLNVERNHLSVITENYYAWTVVPDFNGTIHKGTSIINKTEGVIYVR